MIDGVNESRAVLVTGCSSGIGRATAVLLARTGFTTFATVRKEKDREALAALDLPSLVPIFPLDLANPSHFRPVAERIDEELGRRGIRGIYAIVSNAGGGFVAPVEAMDLSRFQNELETRVVGPIRLLQLLLPAVRAGRGRLVWIVTPGPVAIPYVASIHASEFATHCVAQTLSAELHPWGIPSVLVTCGGIETAASARTSAELNALLDGFPAELGRLYGATLTRLRDYLLKFDRGRAAPDAAAAQVLRALVATRPRPMYRAGKGALMLSLLRFLPRGMVNAAMRATTGA